MFFPFLDFMDCCGKALQTICVFLILTFLLYQTGVAFKKKNKNSHFSRGAEGVFAKKKNHRSFRRHMLQAKWTFLATLFETGCSHLYLQYFLAAIITAVNKLNFQFRLKFWPFVVADLTFLSL